MMRGVQVDIRLPFDTADERDQSEDILLLLLATVARQNLLYLKGHPETLPLYESGVRYALPDQMSTKQLSSSEMKQVVGLLQKLGVDDDTVIAVVRRLRGEEVFRDIPTIYRRGQSDCNDLACVRVAELWRCGVKASPSLTKRKNERGGWTYHAFVQWPDGSSEDPSLILGMEGAAGARERADEIRKNYARRRAFASHAANAVGGGPLLRRVVALSGLVPKGGFPMKAPGMMTASGR